MTAKLLTQKEQDAIEQWWKPHSPAHPFLAQEVATPGIVINHLLGLVKELREVLDELVEVATLRGDNDLPHPANDYLLWTARMQTAWEEAEAILSRLNGEGD